MNDAPTQRAAAWTTLVGLPDLELAWTNTLPEQSGVYRAQDAPKRQQAPAWANLWSAFSRRMAKELELEEPRVHVITHEGGLLILGERDDARVLVVMRDPRSVGLAMVKVRDWLDAGAEGAAS